MQFTKPITEIIKQRISVRTYSKSPIEPKKVALIGEFFASNSTGPFQTNIRFQLITANQHDVNALKGLGTYGMIKNPAGFIVGATESSGKDMEDFGYAMEKIILFATGLGLGTCWLGGSFRQSNFAKAIAASNQESVPAVTSIGNIAEKRRLFESFIRRGAGSDKRLPWEKLFFHKAFDEPLSQDTAGSYAVPLAMLRLAPSASNKQPWRIVKEADTNIFHFYLQRTKGYNRSQKKFFRMADLQRVDMGITMCHFELTATEQGLAGKWEIADPGMIPLPEDTKYVVSWKE
jgi:hypothetical protein